MPTVNVKYRQVMMAEWDGDVDVSDDIANRGYKVIKAYVAKLVADDAWEHGEVFFEPVITLKLD